jgi:hypothetical protein
MSTEDPTTRSDRRYPLAFDSNGNPVALPDEARAWRVRRGGGRRGRPRNVFNPETGRQLEIPLGAGLDELIEAGCPPDRYLLYPIDGEGRVLPGIVAVTEIIDGVEDDDDDAVTVSQADPLVRELLVALKASNETLCRALEATTSGYGPVRAAQPLPPPPMYVTEPPKDESGMKPEQMMQIAGIAKMVFDTLKSGLGGLNIGGAPPATGATP